MPAAAVFDGSERADDQNVRDMLVICSVAIEITAIKPTLAEVSSDLNDKIGLIRVALAASPTLGGIAQRIRYLGCDEPQVVDLTEAPCEASIQVDFEIERLEQHATPYS